MLRNRWLPGSLIVLMLLLNGCQNAPAPGVYNDRIGVAQQATPSRDEQAELWKGFNPYVCQERFQTTLSNGELVLKIDAQVVAPNLAQYYIIQSDYFRPSEQEAKQMADCFYGENQYTLDEAVQSSYGNAYRFRPITDGEWLNLLIVWEDSVYVSNDQETIDTSNRQLASSNSVKTTDLISQADALISRCGFSDDIAYGHPIVQLFDVGKDEPVAHITYLREYEGLPVYPLKNLSIGGSYLADQQNADSQLKGEGLSLYCQDGKWLLNGHITRAQSRQAVELLPFSQIMASFQEQLSAYPPVIMSNGAMIPVTVSEVWLAYAGVPVVDSGGTISAVEYRPSWIFAEGPNNETLYGRYLVAVDAVTGEVRSLWR
ncbi:MAG: hypothetical protein ACOYJA_12460 [Christensenellales bacterium]|jgi:hypothetical protein